MFTLIRSLHDVLSKGFKKCKLLEILRIGQGCWLVLCAAHVGREPTWPSSTPYSRKNMLVGWLWHTGVDARGVEAHAMLWRSS